ncbi:hypothetical protein [Sphaerothrix gracilis]|uniref:hypothetical protein n=1 Tax=Sphaerothrix gracilis TaxID=3151835 RepID=UPI0031FC66AC
MIKSPSLVAASLLALTFGSSQRAEAKEAIALIFDLPEMADQQPTSPAIAEPSVSSTSVPLPIPPAAAQPPLSSSTQSLPRSVYTPSSGAIAPNELVAALPPPPPAVKAPTVAQPSVQVAAQPAVAATSVALNFELETNSAPAATTAVVEAPEPLAPAVLSDLAEQIFQGGTDSLVARAVGSAEGTRTPEGLRTSAFYGHVDPGNGVWNLGTFSYQHGAQSPEEADDKQLRRLQSQSEVIQEKANSYGIELTLAERLNALDLANQSPRAALSRGGYMDWLAEARKLGMTDSEAILWARTRSFLDPDTQRWNAPGLGNNVHSISRDQERRMRAIARAVNAYEQSQPSQSTASVPPPTPVKAEIGAGSEEAAAADFIFSLDLDSFSDNAAAIASEEPAALEATPTPTQALETDQTASSNELSAEAQNSVTETPAAVTDGGFSAPGLEPAAPPAPVPQTPKVSTVPVPAAELEAAVIPRPKLSELPQDPRAVPQVNLYSPAVDKPRVKAGTADENLADFFDEIESAGEISDPAIQEQIPQAGPPTVEELPNSAKGQTQEPRPTVEELLNSPMAAKKAAESGL